MSINKISELPLAQNYNSDPDLNSARQRFADNSTQYTYNEVILPGNARKFATEQNLGIDAIPVDTQVKWLDSLVSGLKLSPENTSREITLGKDFYPQSYVDAITVQAIGSISFDKDTEKTNTGSDWLNKVMAIRVGLQLTPEQCSDYGTEVVKAIIDEPYTDYTPFHPKLVPDLVSVLNSGKSNDPLIENAIDLLTKKQSEYMSSTNPKDQTTATYFQPQIDRLNKTKQSLVDKEAREKK